MNSPCGDRHAPLGGHLHPAPHSHCVHGVEGHRPKERRALFLSGVLTVAAMVVEVIGGWYTGSLMLLSDSVHMLSHAVSLGISYFAIRVAARPRTPRSHFGLYRAEILASLANGIGLVLLAAWIVVESVERMANPVDVLGLEMMAVAAFGLVVNLLTVWMLGRSGAEDLNTKSAFLHMLGDLFSSVVIVLGGLVLIYTGWNWIDPALSLLVAVLIAWWSVSLIHSSTSILLERAPKNVEPDDVLAAMRAESGVRDVHDLHVWEITSGYVCLTAHVVVEDGPLSETHELRNGLSELLRERFRVTHVTLQVETEQVEAATP